MHQLSYHYIIIILLYQPHVWLCKTSTMSPASLLLDDNPTENLQDSIKVRVIRFYQPDERHSMVCGSIWNQRLYDDSVDVDRSCALTLMIGDDAVFSQQDLSLSRKVLAMLKHSWSWWRMDSATASSQARALAVVAPMAWLLPNLVSRSLCPLSIFLISAPLKMTDVVQCTRTYLTDVLLWESGELLYTGRSSFLQNKISYTVAIAVTLDRKVWAHPLHWGTSAQRAELLALTQANC